MPYFSNTAFIALYHTRVSSGLTLSITAEDKRLLKQAALDRDTTVAALVHEWVQRTYAKKQH